MGATEMQDIKGMTDTLSLLQELLLVARYDQPDAAVYQVLHTLLAALKATCPKLPYT